MADLSSREKFARAVIETATRNRRPGPLSGPRRAAFKGASWLLYDWRRFRRFPVTYVVGVIERSCQRLAVRWYPSASSDFEDCEACSIAQDVCVFHLGAMDAVTYVSRRLPDLVGDPAEATRLETALFPES